MSEIQNLQTRGDVATSVANFIGDTGLARRAMILESLDRHYRTLIRKHRWPQLIRWVDSLVSTEAGQQFVHLPKEVRVVIGFADTSLPFNLTEWSAKGTSDFTHGSTTLTGAGITHAHVGDYGINTILTTSTELEVASVGSDTRTVVMNGRLIGENRSVEVTLSGTTTVSVGLWDEVYSFSVILSKTTPNKSVIVRAGMGGNIFDVGNPGTVLATIDKDDSEAVFHRHRVEPIPATTAAIRIVYYSTPPPTITENFRYPIPVQEALFEYAAAEALESRRQYVPARVHRQQAEQALEIAMGEVEAMKIHVAAPIGPPMRPRIIRYI